MRMTIILNGSTGYNRLIVEIGDNRLRSSKCKQNVTKIDQVSSKMIDKPKTNIEELLKNPSNGKYLKVVARKFAILIIF